MIIGACVIYCCLPWAMCAYITTFNQQYSQFDWWRKSENPQMTTDLPQVTDKLQHTKVYHYTSPSHCSPSSVVDREFEPRSGQIKDYKIGIFCFLAKHVSLRKKSKGITENCWLGVKQQSLNRHSIFRVLYIARF